MESKISGIPDPQAYLTYIVRHIRDARLPSSDSETHNHRMSVVFLMYVRLSPNHEVCKGLTISYDQALCRETMVWRQLKHPYILPFLGTTNIQLNFEPRLCLISPWAAHGSAVSYFWEMNLDSELELPERVRLLEQWVSKVMTRVPHAIG